MIRVAVYDDNKPRRESLQAFISLSPELEHAGSFENCAAILQDMAFTKPDIILMDIEMPGGNGIDGVRLVKHNYPQIKIIMQTAFDDDDKVFAALQAGINRQLDSHCLEEEKHNLTELLNKSLPSQIILIGPEGDFSKKEIDLALQNNFIPVSLGETD